MRPVLVLLAALRFALASDVSMAGYLPADTTIVVGVNVRTVADSGLFQEVAGSIPKEILPGFDVMKDLDEVLIGSIGTGEKPPSLAVLRGRFNIEKFSHNATRYNGVPILGPVALIDETTALAGDMELVHAAIDRGHQAEKVMPRIDLLRERYSIWGYGADLPTMERFEFGAGFEKGLQLTAEIRVRSDKDAEQMTSTLKLIEAMMKMKGVKKPSNGSAFDMSVDQGTFKLSLAIPEAELKKAIKEERGSMLTAIGSGMPLLRPKSAVKTPVAEPVSSQPAPAPAAAPKSPATPKPPVIGENGDTVIVTLPGAP